MSARRYIKKEGTVQVISEAKLDSKEAKIMMHNFTKMEELLMLGGQQKRGDMKRHLKLMDIYLFHPDSPDHALAKVNYNSTLKDLKSMVNQFSASMLTGKI